MTTYITKNDKNGKPRYYKSEDNGKLKVISRAEYEANVQTAEPEVETVALVPAGFWDARPAAEKPEDAALSVVKRIVSDMGGKAEKVKTQVTKHSVLINYRNCMVCALVFDETHSVTAIRFMGSTLEDRKKATVCEVKSLNEYADEIEEQVVFIDWWWANPSKKKSV